MDLTGRETWRWDAWLTRFCRSRWEEAGAAAVAAALKKQLERHQWRQ